MSLISFTNRGIYCKQGDFYIDPWLPVDFAVITHGHSDHARFGMRRYLCHHLTKVIIKTRIAEELNVQSVEYGESVVRNGVKISFHPAGHVIGSAQVRLEYKGEVSVVSGDYKIEYDNISTAFDPVKCHTFVSESTFGLPIYNWKPQSEVINNIKQWTADNIAGGKTTVLIAYSLGKAQRLLKNIGNDFPVYVHNSISRLNDALTGNGVDLPTYTKITTAINKANLQQGVLIVPPALRDSKWLKSLQNAVTGVCSGWMQVRSHRRWQSADAGFALSDHADWSGLLQAIKFTEAEKVYITHGFTSAFSRYLNENGWKAEEVTTRFGTEESEESLVDIKTETA